MSIIHNTSMMARDRRKWRSAGASSICSGLPKAPISSPFTRRGSSFGPALVRFSFHSIELSHGPNRVFLLILRYSRMMIEWRDVQKFMHPGVWKILFSPHERFVLTWNGDESPNNKSAIIVWDCRTGKALRKFAHPGGEWPCFKASYGAW